MTFLTSPPAPGALLASKGNSNSGGPMNAVPTRSTTDLSAAVAVALAAIEPSACPELTAVQRSWIEGFFDLRDGVMR